MGENLGRKCMYTHSSLKYSELVAYWSNIIGMFYENIIIVENTRRFATHNPLKVTNRS